MEWNEKFDAAHRKLRTKRATSLTDAEARQLVIKWLWCDEQIAWGIDTSNRSPDEILLEAGEDIGHLGDPEDPGTLAVVQEQADAILADAHVALNKRGDSYKSFSELLRRAMLERARRRRAGLVNDHSAAYDLLFEGVRAGTPEPSTSEPNPVTFGEMADLYMSDPSRAHLTPKSVADYKATFRMLKELVGEKKPARDVTRDSCRDVLNVLMRLPPHAKKRFRTLTLRQAADRAEEKGLATLSPKSVNGLMGSLSTLMNWGVREGLLDRNVAERLRVSEPASAKRQARDPFSLYQLTTIFSAAPYNDPDAARDAMFWLPLMSLFGGLRMGEAAQLHVNDVALLDGIDCIIVRRGGGRSVKTAAGERVVPVHGELKKCGFLEFVADQREAGHERLFTDLPRGRDGYYSSVFQKRYSRHLRAVGAYTPKTTFHSYRHNATDALRNAGVPPDRVRAIMGWTGSGMEEQVYGQGYLARVLASEVEKIDYPDLDLSRLYVE